MPIMLGIVAGIALLIVVLIAAIAKLKESGDAMRHSTRELLLRLQGIEERMQQLENTTSEKLSTMRVEMQSASRSEREETARNFHLLRESMESMLHALQDGNERKLDKMREVVEEKLHTTLEQRLGTAFSSVSDRLDRVHKGLGEMVSLASDVGDLRNVLKNVKIRGTWGEIQLGALLEQIMNRDQYEANVAVRPESAERVEFAVKLPGSEAGKVVWMPIDSKFPQEDYLRMIEASERGDAETVGEAKKVLEKRVAEEAKKIRAKYIEVPHTTDFGILFLPVEGLYSEVIRMDGLCERLMRKYRIVIAGPTTIAALLNSLQMGFRTLAVERRSSEVWGLLGEVRTEFSKFGEVLQKVRSKIEQAGRDLDSAGQRSRAIERRLDSVTEFAPAAVKEEPMEP